MDFATLFAHVAHADRTSLIPLDPKPIRFDWYPGSSIGPVYRKGKQIGHALKDEIGHVTLKLTYRGEKLERDKLPWRGLVQMVEAWADGVDAAQAYGERPRYALVSEGGAGL